LPTILRDKEKMYSICCQMMNQVGVIIDNQMIF
jgi:hypothetical protein